MFENYFLIPLCSTDDRQQVGAYSPINYKLSFNFTITWEIQVEKLQNNLDTAQQS